MLSTPEIVPPKVNTKMTGTGACPYDAFTFRGYPMRIQSLPERNIPPPMTHVTTLWYKFFYWNNIARKHEFRRTAGLKNPFFSIFPRHPSTDICTIIFNFT